MPIRRIRSLCWVWIFVSTTVARAQLPAAEDQTIDTIRTLPQIGDGDRRRIQEWVDIQIDKVAKTVKEKRQEAAGTFRAAMKTQFNNPADTPAFRSALRAQLAQSTVARVVDPKLDRWVGFAIVRTMVDFNAIETVPGFIAGLKSSEEMIRYLSADGLATLNASLPGDKEKFDQAIAALRAAGESEASLVVLGRIYAALAYPAQIPVVFDAYMAIFDQRGVGRRAAAGAGAGGEVEAFEFFRNPAVLSALSSEQKSKLAAALAVFLRADAERYDSTGLSFDELDRLERALDGAESIAAELAGAGKGGKIRDEIGSGGHDSRGNVRAEAYKWVGNPATKDKGALNEAPFNVPVGAP